MKRNSSSIYILITAFCFGSASFQAMQLTFIRFLIGGVILLPFAIRDLKKRQYHITVGDWIYLLILGVICICISMFFFQLGIMHTNANMAAIIISANPVFTMAFAHFLVNDRFTKRRAVVLVISLLGLVIVANPTNLMEGNEPKGLIFVLIASITFGLYTALGKKRVDRIGGLAQNSFSFLLGSAVALIILLVGKMPILKGISWHSAGVIAYLGIVVTGIGYYTYLKAIELSGPSTASIAFFIKPVLAVSLAALILHESITLNVVVGMLLILVGFIINTTHITWRKMVGFLHHKTSQNQEK